MALALYRKYRPQTFGDITGQHHVKITLQNELSTDRVAHAYLFVGPRGVGKTTTARILAKAVNCEKRKAGESEPCDECPSCTAIREGRALDVTEIDAASNTGVDNVRETVIDGARFTPTSMKRKVFVIDEVHMLSTSAFNALLKTLEEPPAHAMFILATTELHKVPATIVSRCQRFDFRKIATPDLQARLAKMAAQEGREVAPSVIAALARAGGGSLRDAETLLAQVLSVTDGAIGDDEASLVLPRSDATLALAFLEAALRRDAGASLSAVATIGEEGVDPVRFADDCIAMLRMMLLTKLERDAGLLAGEYDAETAAAVGRVATDASLPRVTAAIELLLTKRDQMKRLDAGLLPLELAAVEIAAEPTMSQEPGARSQGPAPVVKGQEARRPGGQEPVVVHPTPPTAMSAAPAAPIAAAPVAPMRATARAEKTTIDDVRRQWQDFIGTVGEMNHSLPFVLNVSAPLRMDDGVLVIGTRYPFHCDKLNEEKHYRSLRAAVEKVFGEDFSLRAEVSADVTGEREGDVAPLTVPMEKDPALSAVLSALGGKVVE